MICRFCDSDFKLTQITAPEGEDHVYNTDIACAPLATGVTRLNIKLKTFCFLKDEIFSTREMNKYNFFMKK